jgi:DNA repair ATPase RecN
MTDAQDYKGGANISVVQHIGQRYTQLLEAHARIEELEAALATAREDALREAASLCAGVSAFADEMEKPILDLIGNEAKP